MGFGGLNTFDTRLLDTTFFALAESWSLFFFFGEAERRIFVLRAAACSLSERSMGLGSAVDEFKLCLLPFFDFFDLDFILCFLDTLGDLVRLAACGFLMGWTLGPRRRAGGFLGFGFDVGYFLDNFFLDGGFLWLVFFGGLFTFVVGFIL